MIELKHEDELYPSSSLSFVLSVTLSQSNYLCNSISSRVPTISSPLSIVPTVYNCITQPNSLCVELPPITIRFDSTSSSSFSFFSWASPGIFLGAYSAGSELELELLNHGPTHLLHLLKYHFLDDILINPYTP